MMFSMHKPSEWRGIVMRGRFYNFLLYAEIWYDSIPIHMRSSFVLIAEWIGVIFVVHKIVGVYPK